MVYVIERLGILLYRVVQRGTVYDVICCFEILCYIVLCGVVYYDVMRYFLVLCDGVYCSDRK